MAASSPIADHLTDLREARFDACSTNSDALLHVLFSSSREVYCRHCAEKDSFEVLNSKFAWTDDLIVKCESPTCSMDEQIVLVMNKHYSFSYRSISAS